mgnify:CR=1 FL=1
MPSSNPRPATQLREVLANTPRLLRLVWKAVPLLFLLSLGLTLAIAAIQALPAKWSITESDICRGIAATTWPGRLHATTWQDHDVLLDGAHNPEKMAAFAHALSDFSPASRGRRIGVIGALEISLILLPTTWPSVVIA